MRGLYRRGRFYWMGYSVNGRMVYESTKKTTIRDAEIVLADRKREVRDGTILDINKVKNYKFIELAQEYSAWTKQQKGYKSKKTFIRHLVEEFGNLSVGEISTLIVEKWQTKLLEIRKPSTTNRTLACLKHMMTKAVDWKMAGEETLKQVRKVKFQKENNRKLRFLNIDECQRLIDCCSTHLKPIVITALNSGMRRGEILGLMWEQIDLRCGYISLDDTKSGEGRQIPMNQTLIDMFREMPRGFESKYVFTNRNGDPLTDIKHSFNTALRKAEIHNATFHTLRHTCASHLVMNGVDLASVKELLGHKSLSMTMRYSHLAPGHTKKAVNILDKALKNEVQSEDYLTIT